MDDLTPLFKRAMDANCATQENTELVIQDPERIRTKGRPRESRLKSGVEKKSKRSRRNMDKASANASQNETRAGSSNRQTCMQTSNNVQDMETIVPSSDALLEEFDAFVLSQLTQENV